MDKVALVTGIRGQDGTLLAGRLRALGWRVVGLARPRARDDDPPLRRACLDGCRIVSADIEVPGVIEDAVEALRPQVAFHLAAAHHAADARVEDRNELSARMTAVNFIAAERLARAILRDSPATRLVYAASSQVWTAAAPAERVDESVPRRPANFYGTTKGWAMDCLAHYRVQSGLHASAAILFNHESPLRAPAFVARRIARAAAEAAAGRKPQCRLRNIGAGADWSAASDVVEALRLMADAPEPRDLIVASGRALTVRDLLDFAFGAVGLDWRAHVAIDADRAEPFLVGDPARAHAALGWRAARPMAETIAEMVAADCARLGIAAGAHAPQGV